MPRRQDQDRRVGTLADELAKLVPRHREEHESGQVAVRLLPPPLRALALEHCADRLPLLQVWEFDIAGHINRLCAVWLEDSFISQNARTGLSGYHLSDDDVFVLRGKGTRASPFAVSCAPP